MRLTKLQLKRIIKEELEKVMQEAPKKKKKSIEGEYYSGDDPEKVSGYLKTLKSKYKVVLAALKVIDEAPAVEMVTIPYVKRELTRLRDYEEGWTSKIKEAESEIGEKLVSITNERGQKEYKITSMGDDILGYAKDVESGIFPGDDDEDEGEED